MAATGDNRNAEECLVRDISAAHLEYLSKRGIDERAAREAGLWTATRAQAAAALGIAGLETGGLAIPYPNDPSYVRVRMDGGASKFLAPAGRTVPTYVPPGVNGLNGQAIVVVEGPIKAVAAQLQGVAAVGLGGTGTTLTSGVDRYLNESWEAIHLVGSPVVILFDSNRMTNPNVARDEARLALALERAKAEVCVAALPHGPGGRDWGPDDFLAHEGVDALLRVIKAAVPADPVRRVEQLLEGREKLTSAEASSLLADVCFLSAIAERGPSVEELLCDRFPRPPSLRSAVRRVVSDRKAASSRKRAASAATRYVELDGGLAVVPSEGASPVRFTNFVARIQEDVLLKDGETEDRRTFILGVADAQSDHAEVRITPGEMTRPGWHLARLGASAQVDPIPRANEHLLAAIQRLSTPRRTVMHTHTGWTIIEGEYVFLHAGGAIGREGVQTLLEGPCARYQLPAASTAVAEAVRLSLRVLDAAPLHASMALLLGVLRGPLNVAVPMDAVIHVQGVTGTMKSTLAALVLSHWGEFQHDQLPISWGDTEASIEDAVFRLKDAAVVIDDFAPGSNDPKDDQRRRFSHVVRSIGNRVGRGRMSQELSRRPTRPPRAVVISTGEDLPREESIMARTLIVPIHRGDVNVGVVSEIRARVRELPNTTVAFIEWLAARLPLLRSWLPVKFRAYRDLFQARGQHLRSGAAVAHLAIAGEAFARFAVDIGVFDHAGAHKFLGQMQDALSELLKMQSRDEHRADPVTSFLSCLEELLSEGKLVLLEKGSSFPPPDAGDRVIGFKDASSYFLFEKSVYAAVGEAMRKAGEPLALSVRAFWGLMREAAVLVKEEVGHNTVKRPWGIDRASTRFIRLSRQAIAQRLGTPQPSGKPGVTLVSGVSSP